MPPKKVFSGQADYLSRSIHYDLLELFPESTNESAKVIFFSLNPRLKIADGLYDKGNWVRDAKTSKTRLFLFKKWFLKRKLFTPHRNIWIFDLEKLVVPGIFMDSDLLTTIAQNYDLATRIVRRIDGECLIRINAKEI